MTIAEKLTEIAENMQKVYDAGYAKGYEDGYAKGYEDAPKPIITFTIQGMGTYEAEEGMTWGEWVASDYNTDGFYISDWNTIYNGVTSVRDFNYNEIPPTEIIEVDKYYQIG
jgi:hypothetical protein